MTAILEQGNRTARLTANRSLGDFMNPNRQKMFGFEEFPTDFRGVKVNGETPDGWEQLINDGDSVVIVVGDAVPGDSLGPEAVSSSAAESHDLRNTIDLLQVKIASLELRLEKANVIGSILTELNEEILCLEDSAETLAGEIRSVAGIRNKISELNSELNA